MARILEEELQEILPSPTDLSPFIEIGSRFVTEHLGSVSSLSSAQLKDIELYVSAHFAAMTVERGAPRFEQAGDSRVSWEFKGGEGLNMTRFGKMALLVDTSGTLSTLSGKDLAQFRAF